MTYVRTAFRVWGEFVFPRKPLALLGCGPLPSPRYSSSISLLFQSPQLPPQPLSGQSRFFHSSIPPQKTTQSPPPPAYKKLHRKACVGCVSRVYRYYSFFLFPYYFSRQLSKYIPPLEGDEPGKGGGEKAGKAESRQVTDQVDAIVAEYYLAHNVNPSKRSAWISGSGNTEKKAMDIQEQGHVVIGATVLAHYRLLRRDFTDKDALQILQKALLGCGPNWAYSFIELPLDLSSNKRRLLMEQDQLMGKIHDSIDLVTDCLAGRSYDLSIWSDSVNDSIVTVTVNKCFFHSFFEEQGDPQLTELFCNWEKEVLLSNIEPHKHYLKSQRTKCLAKGDKNCHFCLHHKERSDCFDTLKNFLPET